MKIERKDTDSSLYLIVNPFTTDTEYLSFKRFIDLYVSETDKDRATNGELQDFREILKIGKTMQLAGKTIQKALDYKTAMHFRPSAKNSNARCLNGSAHINKTTHIEHVTCELCKDPKHNAEYWRESK